MTPVTDYDFDIPVLLRCAPETLIRTKEQATCILRSKMQERLTMEGFQTLQMLERAVERSEIEEARRAFCSWALYEELA